MRLSEQLYSVLLSIKANKLRVFLTSLGIIIGTFTIIMVIGIGKASETAIGEQYKRLSVETITINRTQMRFGRIGPSRMSSRSLTKADVEDMPYVLNNVKAVGIITSTQADVVYNGASTSVDIQGTNEDYANITNLRPLYGEFYTDDDGTARNRLAVLGYNVATDLFGEVDEICVGETVKIKGVSFTVAGILERLGGSGGVYGSADDTVFIPYDVATKYMSGFSIRDGAVTIAISTANISYIALANDIQSVGPAIAEINAYIEEICGSDPGYNVSDIGSTLSSALETSDTMSTLLMAVALIVMVVSGIGIMNVLMVAVSERTREIGILKSIGAKRRDILSLFLLEALFISILGGLLGIGLSAWAPKALTYLSVEFEFSVQGLIIGLGFSVITGIFFGFYPAYTASKLKPIEALNKE